jgi:hypothetical protein
MGLLKRGKGGKKVASPSLEDPAFGVCEGAIVRTADLSEGLFDGLEVLGEVFSGAGKRGGALIGILGLGAAGIAKERLPRGGIGRGTIGRQEGAGVSRGERMAGRGVGEALLFGLAEATQLQRRRKR